MLRYLPAAIVLLALTAGTSNAQTKKAPVKTTTTTVKTTTTGPNVSAAAAQPVLVDIPKLMAQSIEQVRAQLGSATNPFSAGIEPDKKSIAQGKAWLNSFKTAGAEVTVGFSSASRKVELVIVKFTTLASPDPNVLKAATNTLKPIPQANVKVQQPMESTDGNYTTVEVELE